MSEINLAEDMIAYSKLKAQMAELEEKIQVQVLKLGKTFKIGDVSATFYQPTYSYDYKGAAEAYGYSQEAYAKNTKTEETTSWKGVCETIGVTLNSNSSWATEKPARVVVK